MLLFNCRFIFEYFSAFANIFLINVCFLRFNSQQQLLPMIAAHAIPLVARVKATDRSNINRQAKRINAFLFRIYSTPLHLFYSAFCVFASQLCCFVFLFYASTVAPLPPQYCRTLPANDQWDVQHALIYNNKKYTLLVMYATL